MPLKPDALSRDGYIIDQRRTDNLRFGLLPSSKNGCGWIACYNFLHALGKDPDPEQLLGRMEKTLPFGGLLGTHLLGLIWELRHNQGLPLSFAVDSFHARELAERAPAGIILYRAGRTNHFAAFRREEGGKLRFFGAVPGRENCRMSLGEFFWDYVKFPLTLTITLGPAPKSPPGVRK